MTTKQTLDELKNFGVDTQRFDINQRIQMIIDEQNRNLQKLGLELKKLYDVSDKTYSELALGDIQ